MAINVSTRNTIHKFPLLYQLCRYITDKNNAVFYSKLNKNSDNKEKIKILKASQKGKYCFIIGNGPSLNINELNLIINEDCFASNLIFRIFNDTKWRPKYYFIQDIYADTGNILDTLNLEYLFVGDYYWRKRGINNKNAICFRGSKSSSNELIDFSFDMVECLVSHYTITYTMIQAAVYMEYQYIYLLGMDHNYEYMFDKKGTIIREPSVKSHIFEDIKPNEVIANIEGMNKAYISAKNAVRNRNIAIFNCTKGGKLEWFPRKDLQEVLNDKLLSEMEMKC